ncbi:TonB-dependent receptor [Dysgonomonas sp. Marseille-P4677]|uniref:TonB-dependent receptor n=1 Tax=Dysgonomonas sp. Marseille-P4677 TaxID=2364790 RepID=UPI001913F15A|nr:TonB-dependent receptor [Dysgonomonas sp. Marseille-P4677]MBK5721479.1 TonB-dependent receptor [Dysgonomonas sp. Marseille-P4677]
MKKVFLAFSAFMSGVGAMYSQQQTDSLKLVKLEEVVVSATRVSRGAPIAYSNLGEVEIKKDNATKNIPYILQNLPSVVSYTEGGTAVGNTALRIRGTDASRINVTLNGMPLNNPESQEVYWVNLPDISNSLQSLQVQRGVGTSTSGTASFGASISMQTAGGKGNKPYADLSSAYGQYNTLLLTGAAGTGIMRNGLSVDARYSYIKSDGYIRNGKVDHKNIYAALSHYSDKQLIRLIYMNGIQHTGITWLGVDPSKIESDRRYNEAGEYEDDNGKTRYYDNETDNYYSNIGQVIYSRYLTNNLTLNANLSYNNGYGYYENYKTGESFADYGLSNQIINGNTHESSDLILRKLMQNDFYVGSFNLDYKVGKFGIIAGTTYSYYDGHHYGRLLWVKQNQNIPNDYEWNRNKAVKQDMNVFLKTEYRPVDNLSLFAEVQERYIDYRMRGLDDDLADLTNKNYYNFVNPKGGISFRFSNYNEIYGSFGISNREPLRADLKESLKGGKTRNIRSERLYDYELGYKYANSIVSFSANFYYMDYKDQLVQTGKLNDVGYKLQENVPDSYRTGVELSLAYTPTEWLRLDGNLTLSRNKIKNYTVYYDLYDNRDDWNKLGQISVFHKSTDISFSPNVVSSFGITFKPFEKEDFTLSFINKYVGKMYYDNTSNPYNRLQDYLVTDMIASYTLDVNKIGKFDFQFFINNLASIKYSANAWVETVKFDDGTEIVYKGLYPQAGANLLGKIRYRF